MGNLYVEEHADRGTLRSSTPALIQNRRKFMTGVIGSKVPLPGEIVRPSVL